MFNIIQSVRMGLKAKMGVNMNQSCDVGGFGMATKYRADCWTSGGVLRWSEDFHNLVVNAGLNDILTQYFKGTTYTAAFYLGLIGAGTGSVAVTSGAAAVTGTSTSFANGDNGSDILIVGAGAAGADFFGTVSGNPGSTTALTISSNAGTTVTGAGYAIEPRAADTMSSKSFNETAPYSNATRPAAVFGSVASQSVDNTASPGAFTINTTGRVYGCFLSTNNTKSGTTGTLYGGGLFTTSRQVFTGDVVNVNLTLTNSATP
jgi:hypothetical protein